MFEPQKFMEMMKKASEVERRMQESLKNKLVYGSAGGGMVQVEMNGQYEVQKLSIDPSIVKADEVEFLSDMVQAAVNQAVSNARSAMADQVREMSSQIPDFFKQS